MCNSPSPGSEIAKCRWHIVAKRDDVLLTLLRYKLHHCFYFFFLSFDRPIAGIRWNMSLLWSVTTWEKLLRNKAPWKSIQVSIVTAFTYLPCIQNCTVCLHLLISSTWGSRVQLGSGLLLSVHQQFDLTAIGLQCITTTSDHIQSARELSLGQRSDFGFDHIRESVLTDFWNKSGCVSGWQRIHYKQFRLHPLYLCIARNYIIICPHF